MLAEACPAAEGATVRHLHHPASHHNGDGTTCLLLAGTKKRSLQGSDWGEGWHPIPCVTINHTSASVQRRHLLPHTLPTSKPRGYETASTRLRSSGHCVSKRNISPAFCLTVQHDKATLT
jgi:hypothetical protein